MECVVCSASLEHLEHEGVQLDRCLEGHGFWLDEGELRHVVDTVKIGHSEAEKLAALDAGVPASEPDPDAAPVRSCPVCGLAMEKVNYDETSGIMIDNCLGHGVWLDAGELERVEAWIEANSDELAPIRRRLDEELAENQAELDAAEAAGRGKGPLGIFFAFWHYARHSQNSGEDRFGKDHAEAPE